MARRRAPLDIVEIKRDINDGYLKAYVGKGVLKHHSDNTYEFGQTIYLQDTRTGETVQIGVV